VNEHANEQAQAFIEAHELSGCVFCGRDDVEQWAAIGELLPLALPALVRDQHGPRGIAWAVCADCYAARGLTPRNGSDKVLAAIAGSN
jgi:hypothetical protein